MKVLPKILVSIYAICTYFFYVTMVFSFYQSVLKAVWATYGDL